MFRIKTFFEDASKPPLLSSRACRRRVGGEAKIKNIQKNSFTVKLIGILLFILAYSFAYSQDTISGKLPDVLKLNNGQIVTTAQQWITQRRPEILKQFEEKMYGESPKAPANVVFSVLQTKSNLYNGLATRKQVRFYFDGKTGSDFMDILIYYPQKIKKPVPVFLGYNFAGNEAITSDKDIIITKSWMPTKTTGAVNNRATNATRGIESGEWPLQFILQHGYALATIYAGDVAPDYKGGDTTGVQSLYPEFQNRPDNFGTIAAWAWALAEQWIILKKTLRSMQIKS
ncbi:MAG: hypothetical protein ABI359_13700 [Ginsengibacter sp.]